MTQERLARAILFFLFAALALWWGFADAATINAVSCNNTVAQPDVQNAINAASSGDTIMLPAGSCQWQVQINTSKRFILQGAGSSSTTGTRINDSQDPNAGPRTNLVWNTSDDGLYRITGVFWGGTCLTGGSPTDGMIAVRGSTSTFRFDHNNVPVCGTSGLVIDNDVRGVIDNNDFQVISGNSPAMYIFHRDWTTPGSDFGDVSFAAPDLFGSAAAITSPTGLQTAQAMYVESNTFHNAGPAGTWMFANDGWMGGRVVYRFNSYTNCTWANHGTESGGRWRSQRLFEVYNNTFAFTNGLQFPSFVGIRGGTGFVYNNTGTTDAASFVGEIADLSNFRTTDPTKWVSPFFGCTGSNVWDQNSDSTGYACLDQPGRGQSGLISGFSPTPVGWPNQAAAPIYFTNNIINGVTSNAVTNAPTVVIEGRDFFNNTVKPGYSAFQFPHPLASGVAVTPGSPTNLVVN